MYLQRKQIMHNYHSHRRHSEIELTSEGYFPGPKLSIIDFSELSHITLHQIYSRYFYGGDGPTTRAGHIIDKGESRVGHGRTGRRRRLNNDGDSL